MGSEVTEVEYEVQNIVLSVIYEGVWLDLEKLAGALEDANYDPEAFPGISYKSKDPPASFLIFAPGKMNCVGVKSREDATQAIKKLTRTLKDFGVEIESEPRVKVRNVVASFSLDRTLDLEAIAREFKNTEYEPEVFPGLVFRMDEPEVVVLLFASGKCVCAGAESEEEVGKAAKKISERLSGIDFGPG